MDYWYGISFFNRLFHLPVRNVDDQLRRQSTIDRSLSETPFARADLSGKDEKVLIQVVADGSVNPSHNLVNYSYRVILHR